MTQPPPKKREGRWGLEVVGALALGTLLALPFFIGGPKAAGQGILPAAAALADVQDPPAASVRSAELAPILVQWGTGTPYTGNGPPGLQLVVATTESNVLNWTLEGWANETTPPALRLCSQDTVFFDPYNWVFEANGASPGGQGAFVSTPSTVPQRLGPDGDQCFLRVGATGAWHVTVCIEGKPGGPRGIYDALDGRRHHDGWDRCVSKDFQV